MSHVTGVEKARHGFEPVSMKTQPVSMMSFVKHRGHDWNVLHT
jgi:hypothetical protein